MSEEFYQLAGFIEVEHQDELTLQRTHALLAAVRDADDYNLLHLLSRTIPEAGQAEVLVVEVTCDGVPSRNTAGIQYRERLALVIQSDPRALVEVLALRKSFPVMIHQNHGRRGGPARAC
jgi:hypothetical protein